MRTVVLGALALSLAACGSSNVESVEADTASLTEFADRFDRAQLAKDGAALERMVDDDLVFVTSSGERQGKDEFIAGWTAPGDSFEPITLVDRVVMPLGRAAAVTALTSVLALAMLLVVLLIDARRQRRHDEIELATFHMQTWLSAADAIALVLVVFLLGVVHGPA